NVGDTWRLRCEQLVAKLQEEVPSCISTLPSWAITISSGGSRSGKGAQKESSGGGSSGTCRGGEGEEEGEERDSTLVRELRRRVMDLEGEVAEARLVAKENGGRTHAVLPPSGQQQFRISDGSSGDTNHSFESYPGRGDLEISEELGFGIVDG
ncbi:unnamed protein product, partial [Discosporangium mesarthrocarpum]